MARCYAPPPPTWVRHPVSTSVICELPVALPPPKHEKEQQVHNSKPPSRSALFEHVIDAWICMTQRMTVIHRPRYTYH